MELDNKQKVLLAMYVEYQKDIPDMDLNIRAEVLGLPEDVFCVALDKLVNEELINGVKLYRVLDRNFPMVGFNNPMLTRIGLEYVEKKLEIDKTLDGKDKVRKVAENAGTWGWNQIKDITAKMLAEVANKAAGL